MAILNRIANSFASNRSRNVRIWRIVAAFLLVSGIQTVGASFVSAATGPFTCTPNFYQVISGQLHVLNSSNGTYTQIGNNTKGVYNAIGYNSQDNYIYGLSNANSTMARLVKVAADGTVTMSAIPQGLPRAAIIAGDFDTDGNLWVKNGKFIYKIKVDTNVATLVPMNAQPTGADMVFITQTQSFYMLQNTKLSTFTTAGVENNKTVAGLTGTSDFGAGFTDKTGNLYFSQNNTGKIYRIDGYNTATPSAVQVLSGALTNNNDGAACANTTSVLPTTTTTAPTTTSIPTTTSMPTTTSSIATTTTIPTTTSTMPATTTSQATTTTLATTTSSSVATTTTVASTTSTVVNLTTTTVATTSTTLPPLGPTSSSSTSSTTAPSTSSTTSATVAPTTLVNSTTTTAEVEGSNLDNTDNDPAVEADQLASTGFTGGNSLMVGLFLILTGLGILRLTKFSPAKAMQGKYRG